MQDPTQLTGLTPEAIAYGRQFFDAARNNQIEVLTAPLEAGLPANLTNDKGDTLLMLAAYHGHLDTVKLLLKHGADPNRLNDRGQSILAGAVFKKEDEIIEALLAANANPDAGQPSAWQTTKLFKVDKWEQKFEEVRSRLDVQ